MYSDPYFSIIIPVYKVEDFLDRCIEGVLFQVYGNFELILVDDGSPDACPTMCDDWARKDERIIVIHKENGGSSSARNAGLDIAKGNYILFLDSDDYWIDNSLLNDLQKQIETSAKDVVLFGSNNVYMDGTEEKRTLENFDYGYFNSCKKTEALEYLGRKHRIPGAAWIMCVSRKLIEENHLRFVCGVTAEDYEWIVAVLLLSKSIGKIKGIQHAYLKRPGSVTTTPKLSGVKGTMNAIERYRNLQIMSEAMEAFLCRIYLISVMTYNKLSSNDRKAAKQLLNANLSILNNKDHVKEYWFVNIIGYRLSSFTIQKVYNYLRYK